MPHLPSATFAQAAQVCFIGSCLHSQDFLISNAIQRKWPDLQLFSNRRRYLLQIRAFLSRRLFDRQVLCEIRRLVFLRFKRNLFTLYILNLHFLNHFKSTEKSFSFAGIKSGMFWLKQVSRLKQFVV